MNPRALYFQALYQEPYLQGNPSELDYTQSGGSHSLTINTNGNWNVSSKPAWITVNKSSGTGNATVSVTASNNTKFERDGYIIMVHHNNSYLDTCKA